MCLGDSKMNQEEKQQIFVNALIDKLEKIKFSGEQRRIKIGKKDEVQYLLADNLISFSVKQKLINRRQDIQLRDRYIK